MVGTASDQASDLQDSANDAASKASANVKYGQKVASDKAGQARAAAGEYVGTAQDAAEQAKAKGQLHLAESQGHGECLCLHTTALYWPILGVLPNLHLRQICTVFDPLVFLCCKMYLQRLCMLSVCLYLYLWDSRSVEGASNHITKSEVHVVLVCRSAAPPQTPMIPLRRLPTRHPPT